MDVEPNDADRKHEYALQSLLEATHALQTKIFRLALRRSVSPQALNELRMKVAAMYATVDDLEKLAAPA